MKGLGLIASKYLGASFSDCSCMQLLYNIYTDLGIQVPKEYKGYNLNNYMSLWEKHPEQAIALLWDLFSSLGTGVDIELLQSGDAIIVSYDESVFPAIYVGASTALVSTREQGVISIPIGKKFQVLTARRLF